MGSDFEVLDIQNFIDAALRLNIVVNAISAQGLEVRMEGPKDFLRRSFPLMPLENIANGTGGHHFKDTNDLGGAMSARGRSRSELSACLQRR